jgi:protein-tyrosine phosphatase
MTNDTLQSPLKSILNFRDAGDFVNKASVTKLVFLPFIEHFLTKNSRVKTGLLFRSARPGESDFSDHAVGIY